MHCRACGAPLVPHAVENDPLPPGHRRHDGRGLCEMCYTRAKVAGTIADYPLNHRPVADTAEDAVIFYDRGLSLEEIAERLDRAPCTVVRAMWRHRRRLEVPDPALDRVLRVLDRQLTADRWARRRSA